MSDHTGDLFEPQSDSLKTAPTRALLDQLLAESRLYRRGKDYKELLDFVIRLRNFAPFNAMLLQVQKPGLRYAASARDWSERFGRSPKEGARPLLILWPFGPVGLVYDFLDTEGDPVPEDVLSFVAHGPIDLDKLWSFQKLLLRKRIEWLEVDAGDNRAGSIRVIQRATNEKEFTLYRMHINRSHEPAVQFVTLAHELGHLFLGHLGPNHRLNIPQRHVPEHAQRELEAESAAYIVCERQGVKSKSQSYLSNFVDSTTTSDQLNIYQIMRAAGQIETVLDLATQTNFDRWAEKDELE